MPKKKSSTKSAGKSASKKKEKLTAKPNAKTASKPKAKTSRKAKSKTSEDQYVDDLLAHHDSLHVQRAEPTASRVGVLVMEDYPYIPSDDT